MSFTLRAGIASGPLVAGVIGREKFCWCVGAKWAMSLACARCCRDIWGDTVNTASRMEYPKYGTKCRCGQRRAARG